MKYVAILMHLLEDSSSTKKIFTKAINILVTNVTKYTKMVEGYEAISWQFMKAKAGVVKHVESHILLEAT